MSFQISLISQGFSRLGLHCTICKEPFLCFFIWFLPFDTSLQLRQLLGRMLQRCLSVKLQNCSVDLRNFTKVISSHLGSSPGREPKHKNGVFTIKFDQKHLKSLYVVDYTSATVSRHHLLLPFNPGWSNLNNPARALEQITPSPFFLFHA